MEQVPAAEGTISRAEHDAILAGKDAEIERLRAEKDAEIERLRADKDAEIERLRAELSSLRAAFSGALAATATVAAPTPSVPEVDDDETALVRAEIEREERAGEASFWFVEGSYLRNSTALTLPSFRELHEAGALTRHTLSKRRAYRGGYASEMLAVSHRWESPRVPDTVGAQMAAIKAHLEEHPEILRVWYDFWSMPQDERTAAERDAGAPDTRTPAAKLQFKHMLRSVNLLYLGCAVLALCDMSYPSRFWVTAATHDRMPALHLISRYMPDTPSSACVRTSADSIRGVALSAAGWGERSLAAAATPQPLHCRLLAQSFGCGRGSEDSRHVGRPCDCDGGVPDSLEP